MSRVYNFSPGPCALPDEVMQTAQAEFCEYRDLRASILEVSHRGNTFMRLYQEIESDLRVLMGIPENYWVLFLSGGATAQTAMIPMNLTPPNIVAAYAITGYWSRRAATEAERYCSVHIAADTTATGYTTLPTEWDIPDNAAYLHYVDNETVHGVEFSVPPASSLPLVVDMSSNILSKRINVCDYGLIYASAQKNMGVAGVTVVIVRQDLVRPRPETPSVFDYQKQQAVSSMLNTPPTFQIYLLGLILKWIKKQGGIAAIEERNERKAALLYRLLDESAFYCTPVAAECRSRMNALFFLPNEKLNADFLQEADAAGLIGLKGHRQTGGCRASIYNAMPEAGVAALAKFIRTWRP